MSAYAGTRDDGSGSGVLRSTYDLLGQASPSHGALGAPGPDPQVAATPAGSAQDGSKDYSGVLAPRWSAFGRVNKSALGRQALEAIAEALRDGVPVTARADARTAPHAALNATDRPPGDDPDRDSRISALDGKLGELSVAWGREPNPHRRQQLNSEIDQVRAELDALRTPVASAVATDLEDSPSVHALSAERIERVFRGLLAGVSVEREIADAADTVLRDIRVELVPEGRDAIFQCHLRLPTAEDTVLEVGPITWAVPLTVSLGAESVRARLAPSETAPMPSLAATHLLTDAGLVDNAVAAAVGSPFTWLVPVLLHELTGAPAPADVPAAWMEPSFRRWLRHVYSSEQFAYSGRGKYTRMKHTEQAVVYALDRAGGTATTEELMRGLPLKLMTDVRNAAAFRFVNGQNGASTVLELIRPSGEAGTSDAPRMLSWTNIQCRCGLPALHVTLAPEIPRALLCSAGHMPNAEEWGMDNDVVFPLDYLALAPNWSDCIASLTRAYTLRDNPPLGATAAAIMALEGLRPPGKMSTREVADAIGKEHATARASLHHLAMRGRVTPLGKHRTRTWQLVDDPNLPPIVLRADARAADDE